MPEKQDNLDIETTVKPRTPPRVATPPAAPAAPSVHDTSHAPANLDIETTIARPKAPAPRRAPVSVPPPVPQMPADALAVLPIGYVLDDKYVITKVLGKGGLGIVYKATERQTGVEFAIKIVAPELVNDNDARNDLRKEVANAQRLTHQNLLKINYLADSDATTYIVMECIDGENLEEYRLRKGGNIPVTDFLRIAPQVLAALDYLHEKGVVHCDVKPQNIMVTPGGEVKITDYGIARTIKEQLTQVAASQASAGTLAYMAPEQIRGELCDRRADIYSTGIMFYRLLAGRFPFDTNDRQAIIRWHIDCKHVIEPLASPELTRAVERALWVDASERWHTCKEMLEALQVSTQPSNSTSASLPSAAPVADQVLAGIDQLLCMALDFCVFHEGDHRTPGKVIKHQDGTYMMPSGGIGRQLFSALTKSVSGDQQIDVLDELASLLRRLQYEGRRVDPGLRRKLTQLADEARTNLQRGATTNNPLSRFAESAFIALWKKYLNRVVKEFGEADPRNVPSRGTPTRVTPTPSPSPPAADPALVEANVEWDDFKAPSASVPPAGLTSWINDRTLSIAQPVSFALFVFFLLTTSLMVLSPLGIGFPLFLGYPLVILCGIALAVSSGLKRQWLSTGLGASSVILMPFLLIVLVLGPSDGKGMLVVITVLYVLLVIAPSIRVGKQMARLVKEWQDKPK